MALTDSQLTTLGHFINEFRGLFAEFLREYPPTKDGQRHLRLYRIGREQAANNFEEIRRRRAAGEDVTDLVLLKLLPYADTEHNREQGAWIHVAPVITRDVRQLFEASGRATPNDWPKIAALLLQFCETCVQAPDQMAAACERFTSEIPAKGFQSGTLSPILNALRHDHFVVFNKKSREVLNYFTGSSFSTKLSEYAAANAAQLALIQEVSEVIQEKSGLEELPIGDRYDMFCHWLVAVKKHRLKPLGYWKVAPGREAWNWEECRDNGFIAMGWDELGDLTELTRTEFDQRNRRLSDERADWKPSPVHQLWTFAKQIKEGDRIVANHGKHAVLGIGTVTGPYYFVEGVRHGHRLPVEWEDTKYRPVKKSGWMKTLAKLSEEEFEEILNTPDSPPPPPSRVSEGATSDPPPEVTPTEQPQFSPRAFDLLEMLKRDPRKAVYDEHKDEFHSELEAPFQQLMRRVARRLPKPILESMETEKRIFSRIPKNDWGRGGAWPHYWGAFYPKGGRRTEDIQLAVWMNHQRMGIGFYIGEYGSEQRRTFVESCAANRQALEPIIHEHIDSDNLLYGQRNDYVELSPDELNRMRDWRAWLKDPGTAGIRVEVIVPRDEVLSLPAATLEQRIEGIFARVFPLVLIATGDDPIPRVAAYLGLGEEEEPEFAEEYTLSEFANETNLAPLVIERWVQSVERKGQAVFYGPPGTGKTYVAERMAKHLVGGADGFYEVVQFHPAYAYEDFIQGIRPRVRPEGAIDFRLEPGRFLDFCARARKCQGTCVLIIDEINRANLSRVFGELMYLLEYRGLEVPLAGGGKLQIPKNVRIIGTMNTADRSIALVDHALRRRFAFIALYPQYEVLRSFHADSGFDPEPLIQILQRVNTAIGDRHYEVGISFFLKKDLGVHLQDIWQMEIEPYLEEYFFDQASKVDEFRWERVADKVLL